MSDPLAQYRKRPVGGTDAGPGMPEGYLAFGTKDRVERLKIRRAAGPTRAPGYAYLLDIAYDGPFGTNFVLVFTFMMVLVRGRNLLGLVGALEAGTADFIQEFDPGRWPQPADPTAAFIESIEIVVQDNGPSIAEADATGPAPGSRKPH